MSKNPGRKYYYVQYRFIHAGYYEAWVNGQPYVVVRQRGSWWLAYWADWTKAENGRLGSGNAREFKTLTQVWGHLEKLGYVAYSMLSTIPW